MLLAPDRRRVFGWIGLGAVGAGLATVLLFVVARLLVTHGQTEEGRPATPPARCGTCTWGSARLGRAGRRGGRGRGRRVGFAGPPDGGGADAARGLGAGERHAEPSAAAGGPRAGADRGGRPRDRRPGLDPPAADPARGHRPDVRGRGRGDAHARAARARSTRSPATPPLPRSAPAVAAGLVLLALVAAIFTGRALQSEDATATVTACNGHRELCNRRVDDVTFASAHNAMSAATEPGWLFATHEKGIRRQLDDGVRGLLIDTHYGVKTDKGVATDLEAGSKSRAKIEDEVGPEFVRDGRAAASVAWATRRARASARSSCATPTARSGRRSSRTAWRRSATSSSRTRARWWCSRSRTT